MVRLIPVLLAVLWGLNWPAVKIGLSEVPPFMLRVVGLGAGALLLVAVAAVLGRSLRVPRASLLALAIAGVLNIAGFNIASAFAQLNTTTSRAAILTFTTPLWATLFAVILLGEKLDRAKIAALAVGSIGIALLAVPLVEGQKNVWGLVFPLVAAVAWASGTVMQKIMPIEADRIASTGYQLLIGAAIAAVGMVATGEVWPSHVSAPVLAAISFHVVGATAAAYLLWFVMLDRMAVSTATMTSFAIPVVGVLSAMALVGDRPSPLDWVGFAAIMTAASIAVFGAKRA